RLAREMFSWDIAVSPLLNLLSLPATKRLRETDIILDFPDNAGLPVSREQAIEQYFVCRINGLTRVECRIATHNRTIQQPLWLSLYQLEKANGEYRGATKQLIARSELAGDALRNNEWCSLDIEPVADSAGKTFLFKIESDEEDALASASPWAVRGKPYPLLQLYHGENHIDNSSLCFRTTCAGSHE
ncbi:MAG TPA: hypothetical protein PLP17_11215, partial [Oligoflexia bacterium]|nr:hypothetical protein [Oligoflexia bacterium]